MYTIGDETPASSSASASRLKKNFGAHRGELIIALLKKAKLQHWLAARPPIEGSKCWAMMMVMMAEVQGGDGDGGMARPAKLPDVGVAAMSVLAVMVVSILANQTLQRRRRRLPPGPWPWPIVGNFPQLSKAKDVPHRSLRALAAKYGGLMFLRLGTMTIMERFEKTSDGTSDSLTPHDPFVSS